MKKRNVLVGAAIAAVIVTVGLGAGLAQAGPQGEGTEKDVPITGEALGAIVNTCG